jgi:hypothetical protein
MGYAKKIYTQYRVPAQKKCVYSEQWGESEEQKTRLQFLKCVTARSERFISVMCTCHELI